MQTIGERLEEARKRKGISIREAAEATKIRGDYLQKFETNQFEIGLSEIYTRGFLRTYATFLKIPAERLVADFRALSTAEEPKPKTVSREVYGRMDLSIASSGGKQSSKDDLPSSPGLDDDDGGGTKRTFARIGTSLPTGTFIDQRVIKKIALVTGLCVLAVLLIWGVASIASSRSTKPAAAQVEPTITLIALDNVQVKVVQKADGTELYQGTLVRGERRNVPKRGALYITAKDGRNLEIETNGKRYPMPFQGYDRCELP